MIDLDVSNYGVGFFLFLESVVDVELGEYLEVEGECTMFMVEGS